MSCSTSDLVVCVQIIRQGKSKDKMMSIFISLGKVAH